MPDPKQENAAKPRNNNGLALILLIVGKALGVAGLVVAMYNKLLGGMLLGVDGVLIVTAIVLCLRTAKEQAKEAENDKDVVARLVKEGALKQYLRDIEEEERTTKAAE